MLTYPKLWGIFTIYFILSLPCFSQVEIKGRVLDTENRALSHVKINLENSSLGTQSNEEGAFHLTFPDNKEQWIIVSHLGYQTQRILIRSQYSDSLLTVQMEEDALGLDEIVITGVANPASKMNSSIAITTLSSQKLQESGALGTAEYLKRVPGLFAESSNGEVQGRVFARGMTGSEGQYLGWYYVSLQEDGLPVSATIGNFSGPDMYFRSDATVDRLEVIRGGASSITTSNAPGGIINFISKTGGRVFQGLALFKSGIHTSGNPYVRTDLSFGGPLSKDKSWRYHIGGFFRYDRGARDIPYPANQGGQIKGNLLKEFKNGFMKVYGKFLRDQNTTIEYFPVRGTEFREIAGIPLNRAGLLSNVQSILPDGRAGVDGIRNTTREFDSSKGIQNRANSMGLEVNFVLGQGWQINNHTRFNRNQQNRTHWIGNSYDSLATRGVALNVTTGAHPGVRFKPVWGQHRWYDTESGELVASYNMLPSGISNLQTDLPLPVLFTKAASNVFPKLTDFVNQLSISKSTKKNNFRLNAFFSRSTLKSSAFTETLTSTLESNPRALRGELTVWENISAVDPALASLAGQDIMLTDQAGISRYGGFVYNNSNANTQTFAVSLYDNFEFGPKLNINFGARFEHRHNEGEKDLFQTGVGAFSGGLDEDFSTGYDNWPQIFSGEKVTFDENHRFLSLSAGINYQFNSDHAIFGRFTHGNRPPALNYYLNNFANTPINQPGQTEKIIQLELGLKVRKSNFSLFSTAFFSNLSKVPKLNIIIGPQGVFNLPVFFNTYQTFGLETEIAWTPFPKFNLSGTLTLQEPLMKDVKNWAKIDPSLPNIPSSYEEIDYSGNQAPDNPKIIANLDAKYQLTPSTNFTLRWSYLGKRAGNDANAVFLPGFSTFDGLINIQLNPRLGVQVIATNLLNSTGLMEFNGAAIIGTFKNDVTPEQIASNPNQVYMVRPIFGRSIFLQLAYNF